MVPRRIRSRSVFLIPVILAALASESCAYQPHSMYNFPPNIPPEYFNCLEANPTDLLNAYFGHNVDIKQSENTYNEQVFVFKNIVVKDWVVKDLSQGWIWVSTIKCMVSNLNDMKDYKMGEIIDVVGRNKGVISLTPSELLFEGCIVMPTGSVVLPVGGGKAFIPSY